MDIDNRGVSPGRDRDRSRRGDRTGSRFDNNDRDKSRERQESRRIYVSNIPYEIARWQDLKDLFRREVGDVSFVELFNDETGKPRGCGIVEFEKPESVAVALEKMNRYELSGRSLVVKEDFGNERDKFGRVIPKNGGGGGSNSGNGGGGGNSNYRRDRDDDRFNDSSRSHGGGGNLENYNTYGLSVKFLEGLGITQGPLHTKVFVANLDYKVDAKKLKQVFKLAGKVVSLEVSADKDGNSRGFGVVEYDHPVEAVQAISMFDRQILFDRRMTVRLDRVPEKSEGVKLPEGLKGIGIGLGPNGEPLKNVKSNLPNVQNNPAQNISASNAINNLNTLNSISNSLSQLQNQANVPAPVAAPTNSSILGVPPNSSSLSGLTSNLAALTNVVGGLGSLSALSNPLLSSAAASLNSLGINLNSNNDVGSQQQQQSFNTYNTSSFTTGNQSGFNSGSSRDEMPYGGSQMSSVRNYNTSSNDEYNSRNFGNTGGSTSRKQPSDTIIVRNLPSTWTWQNLRDKFRDIGEVKFAEIRGLDTGVVRFSMEREAEVAIKLMDGSRLDGRIVDIDFF